MPIEVTNTPADDSLAVYLASVEDIARRHHFINEHHAMALVTHLRQYMAHAETIERSVEGSLTRLRDCGL